MSQVVRGAGPASMDGSGSSAIGGRIQPPKGVETKSLPVNTVSTMASGFKARPMFLMR